MAPRASAILRSCPLTRAESEKWIAESNVSFRDAREPRIKPLTRFQALVGENQNGNAATPLSKPEDYHRVNSLFAFLDKDLGEIENRFSGNDQDVLCALGYITLGDSPNSDGFDLIAWYCDLDKDLLQADRRLFRGQFKTTHVEKPTKTAAEAIEVLHENSLFEMTPQFFTSSRSRLF